MKSNVLLICFLALFSCGEARFVGPDTPSSDLNNMLQEVDMNALTESYYQTQGEPPKVIHFLNDVQKSNGDLMSALAQKESYVPGENAAALANTPKANTVSKEGDVEKWTDSVTGIQYMRNLKTGIVTTLNPRTQETTSSDAANEVYTYYNPEEEKTTTVNEKSRVTTEVNTVDGITTTFNFLTGEITTIDPVTSISIHHDTANNITKIVDPVSGETRTIQINAKLYTIEFSRIQQTVIVDFRQKKISYITADPYDGIKRTKVYPVTAKRLNDLGCDEAYPVPPHPMTVSDIKATLLPNGNNLTLTSQGIKTESEVKQNSAKTTAATTLNTVNKEVLGASVSAPAQTAGSTTTATATSSSGKAQLTDEELIEKYIAKEKGEAKAANIVKTATTGPADECVKGECCNIETGKYFPGGTPCFSSPCAAASTCIGVSSHCPPSGVPAADGTPCPNGACLSGVCVLAKHLNKLQKTEELKQQQQQATKGAEPVKPSPPPLIVRDHHLKCTSGGCCDLNTGYVKVVGSPCTPSKHECYIAATECNGFESKCPRRVAADGTACEGGVCKNGNCVAPEDVNGTHTRTEKAVAVAQAVSAVMNKGEELVTEEAMRRSLELDAQLAALEDKIGQAQKRQALIKKAITTNREAANRRVLKNALDTLHDYVKTEHDIARKTIYPYQITSTKDQAIDNAETDFNIHGYIRKLAEEHRAEKEEEKNDK